MSNISKKSLGARKDIDKHFQDAVYSGNRTKELARSMNSDLNHEVVYKGPVMPRGEIQDDPNQDLIPKGIKEKSKAISKGAKVTAVEVGAQQLTMTKSHLTNDEILNAKNELSSRINEKDVSGHTKIEQKNSKHIVSYDTIEGKKQLH